MYLPESGKSATSPPLMLSLGESWSGAVVIALIEIPSDFWSFGCDLSGEKVAPSIAEILSLKSFFVAAQFIQLIGSCIGGYYWSLLLENVIEISCIFSEA